MELIYIAILAFLIDLIIGDPNSKYHPVVLIGKAISLGEKVFYHKKLSEPNMMYMGFVMTGILLCLLYAIGWGIVWGLQYLPSQYHWTNLVIQAIILSFMISPKSLAQAGQKILVHLEEGNIDQAREKVNYVVSRDVSRMNEQDIIRATIETIAENTVDGIIAPLFWFFIGGLPLAMAYRCSNTLDAMIGYKNDKYLYFGRAAAKIDDLLNLIPARITGFIFVFVAKPFKLNAENAWECMKRDAKSHPSPNGGFPEAAVAGALGIRLGGLNYYFGHESFRAYMGNKLRDMVPNDIRTTIKLMYANTVVFLILACVVYGLIINH